MTTTASGLTIIDEELDDELSSDEDYSDSDDEEDDDAPTGASVIPKFTFNQPFDPTAQTLGDRKTYLGQLAVFQGVAKDKSVKVRFVIGLKEKNRLPGKGQGEVDAFKREWRKLFALSKKVHWRRLFHNSFEGDYYHKAIPFSIDGVKWKTVTHYMLGMLYSPHRDYSLLYSLEASRVKGGWWGKVESALKEHSENIRTGRFPPDPEFDKKVEAYVTRGLLAKFTQHPELKQALLLTEDAVFGIRGGLDPVMDFPPLVAVRKIIKDNPATIYLGDSVAPQYEGAEIPVLGSPEELNYNYVDLTVAANTEDERKAIAQGLVGGGVRSNMIYGKVDINQVIRKLAPNSILTVEPIAVCDYIVYLATGAYNLNLAELLQAAEPTFVRRHHYALERIGDNALDRILVAVQRTPVSQVSSYLHFYILQSPGKAPASLYLEPLNTGVPGEWHYGIQIVADRKDPEILDYLRRITSGTFISPGAEAGGASDEEDELDE